MKNILITVFLCCGIISFAQNIKCEYDFEEKTDSTYIKKTTEYLVYEKDFVNTTEYLNFSLINSDGLIYLNVQLLQKSKDFIAAKAFNKNSKIYLQLSNGKICALLSSEDVESHLIFDNQSNNNIRILNGYFVFGKDNFEDLKSQKINLIRVQYATETKDYVMKKELTSEVYKKTFFPDSYFINYLKCIE